MALRRLVVVFATLVVTGACTAGQIDPATTSSDPGPATSGRIVVVNDGGNIVTMDYDGSNANAITEDGGSVRYFLPVWSPLSRVLAWGQGNEDGFGIGLRNEERADSLTLPVDGFPFYLNWSPDEMRIGALHNGVSGSVDFVLVDVADTSSASIDSGIPYYFSWSPGADALAVHVDGDRLEILDESADPTDLGNVSSNFLAPQWTPRGIFYVADSGLVLREPDGSELEIIDTQGFVSINPNPDGTMVALHVLSGEPSGVTVGLTTQESAAVNAISIIDVDSGIVGVVEGQIPVGSFWSPDGEKLLMLLISEEPGSIDVRIWEDGNVSTLDTVDLPQSLVNQVLPFLDQYTQSLQLWSPDSSHFVLPAIRNDEPGIWVYGDGAIDPVRISDGEWASWSHA
jgi:hypothetical protein